MERPTILQAVVLVWFWATLILGLSYFDLLVTLPEDQQQTAQAQPHPEAEAEQVAALEGAGPTADDRIADYTFWLTIFTAVLGVGTSGLWWETRRAAFDGKRNMVALQRPQVFVYISNAGLKVEMLHSHMTTSGDNGLQFYVANFGGTVAQLTEIRDELFVRDKDEWPAPQPTTSGRELPPGTFTLLDLPYNEGRRYLADCVGYQDLLAAGSVEAKAVHFSGWVRYVDVFGNRYISGFHYVFDPIGERFVRRGSAEYNYTREE